MERLENDQSIKGNFKNREEIIWQTQTNKLNVFCLDKTLKD